MECYCCELGCVCIEYCDCPPTCSCSMCERGVPSSSSTPLKPARQLEATVPAPDPSKNTTCDPELQTYDYCRPAEPPAEESTGKFQMTYPSTFTPSNHFSQSTHGTPSCLNVPEWSSEFSKIVSNTLLSTEKDSSRPSSTDPRIGSVSKKVFSRSFSPKKNISEDVPQNKSYQTTSETSSKDLADKDHFAPVTPSCLNVPEGSSEFSKIVSNTLLSTEKDSSPQSSTDPRIGSVSKEEFLRALSLTKKTRNKSYQTTMGTSSKDLKDKNRFAHETKPYHIDSPSTSSIDGAKKQSHDLHSNESAQKKGPRNDYQNELFNALSSPSKISCSTPKASDNDYQKELTSESSSPMPIVYCSPSKAHHNYQREQSLSSISSLIISCSPTKSTLGDFFQTEPSNTFLKAARSDISYVTNSSSILYKDHYLDNSYLVPGSSISRRIDSGSDSSGMALGYNSSCMAACSEGGLNTFQTFNGSRPYSMALNPNEPFFVHHRRTPPMAHSSSIPDTAHSSSIPDTAHSSSIPHTAHSSSIPHTAHSLSVPPLDHSLSMPPMVHSLSMPPMAHSLSMPPMVHSFSMPPMVHSFSMPPMVHSLSMPPMTHSSSERFMADYSNMLPMARYLNSPPIIYPIRFPGLRSPLMAHYLSSPHTFYNSIAPLMTHNPRASREFNGSHVTRDPNTQD